MVHLLTDASTGEIVDLAVTAPTEGNSPVFEQLVKDKGLTGITSSAMALTTTNDATASCAFA